MSPDKTAMANALILHGTEANSQDHWFPWLKKQLESKGYKVWAPDLPGADHPNEETYNKFLFGSDFDFNDSLLIGHSSGAVAILKLLQNLPEGVVARKAILVGSFTEELIQRPQWNKALKDMFIEPFDFAKIKEHCREFVFLHSEDDPYCPIDQPEFLYQQLGGEFVHFTDKGHFSSTDDPRFIELSEITPYLS